MWSSCHPKSDEDLKECAELGKSLNRLSQPTILTLLAANDKPMHGYIIVQQAAHSPMFGGKKPDATGIYRALKRMEEAELVTSEWETPEEGSAKRLFTLTDKGRHCLRRWIDALACYELTLEELRGQAAQALGIDLPDAPICSHEE
ncbi:MAG: PadR family transcriptional regulator [Eggerthellaceae bacterium]